MKIKKIRGMSCLAGCSFLAFETCKCLLLSLEIIEVIRIINIYYNIAVTLKLNPCAERHGDFTHLGRRIRMINEEIPSNGNSECIAENFAVQLTNPLLYDRLHILSVEYSVSVEFLVNTAVKHLIDDVDFCRSLRNGN